MFYIPSWSRRSWCGDREGCVVGQVAAAVVGFVRLCCALSPFSRSFCHLDARYSASLASLGVEPVPSRVPIFSLRLKLVPWGKGASLLPLRMNG